MKDSLGGTYRGGRDAFVDVSPRRRCPVCEQGSWCQVARDGMTVLCKRIGNGARPKVNRDGVDFYAHHLGATPFRAAPVAPVVTVQRAPAEVLDAAYRAALAGLRLEDVDRAALLCRGLDDGAINANGYATLPERERARIARAVVDAVGDHLAPGVPGMVWRTGDEGRGWWSFSGWGGLLIPVRDVEGRTVALKVRRRTPGDGPRYLCVTSRASGGPSPGSPVHFPRAALSMRGRPLIVTEGELKADVSTHLAGRPVVSLPGVGAWRMALDVVSAWGAPDVAVAFDADARTNPTVARALVCLVDALRGLGARVEVWRWDGPSKGLDDYLCAVRRGDDHAD